MKYETCYNIDKPSKYHAKRARHKKLQIVWFHLYKISRIGKTTETEGSLVIARAGEIKGGKRE